MSLISPQYVNRLELRIAELEAENAVLKSLLEEHGVTFYSNEIGIADYNAGEFYK